MNTVTCGTGQVSKPIGQLSIGDLVTLTGNGVIQYTESKSTAIGNDTATWTTVVLTNNTFRVMSNGGSVRLKSTSGTCTMTVDDGSVQDALQTAYHWDATSGVYVGVGAKKRLSVELSNIYNVGARPSGADWLFSATRDLDTFTGYLQFEPTIFFDPSASNSLNIGTEENPYNTVTDLNRRLVGNMAGAVIGFKRGTRTYVHGSSTGAGINITCYGSSTSPVLFVPYGDAGLPMPIIDGGEVTGTGTSYVWSETSAGSGTWKITVGVDTDVFEGSVRCSKKTSATTLSNAGECKWDGTYLYYRPRTTANPNDGSLKIPFTLSPILVEHPNVAAVGNVKLIGLDVRYGRGNNILIQPNGTNGSITAIGAVDVLFCRVARNGFDSAAYTLGGSTTGIVFAGVKDAVRMGTAETISSRVIGCEISDATHHAVEFNQHDNGLAEFNYIHDVRGAAVEYYADCSGNVFRNNYASNLSNFGTLDATNGIQGAGALLYGLTKATYASAVAYDDGHTKNKGNKVYNNFFKNCSGAMVICTGGGDTAAATPHKVYNNTFDVDHDVVYPDGSNSNLPAGLNAKRTVTPISTGTTAPPNGFLIFSNNLCYWRYSPLLNAAGGVYMNVSFVQIESTTTGIPTGNNNVYFNQTGPVGYGNWIYGTTTANMGTYKTAMSAYSFDQNSYCAYGAVHPVSGTTYGNNSSNAGDKKTLTEVSYTEATGKPATGSVLIQGGTNASANRLTDYIGQTVIAVATPAIGCYER